MVVRRTLAAFYPACDYDATKIITRVGDHTFRTNGKVIVTNGWRDVPPLMNPPRGKKNQKGEEEERPLPPLKIGDTRPVRKTTVKEDVTKPPAPHTDASLLSAMETAGKELEDEELVRQMKGSGIGTPATRAAIIERLLKVGYAQRKGKTLQPTDKGVALIDLMPGEIASPELTGRWELALHEITDGKQDADRFMEGIRRMSAFLVDYARNNEKSVAFPADPGRKSGKGKGFQARKVPGVVCPLCGRGAVQESPAAFSCAEKDCHFTLWKDCLQRGGGPALNDKIMSLLLEKKQVRGSTGLVMIREGNILFYPTGSEIPSVNRSMIYEKKKG
jgi:DNA topoisomerase-3